MSHPSLGKIQKLILRSSFDGFLPDSVLYREKEQFADGIGPSWVTKLQQYASQLFPDSNDPETTLYKKHLHSSRTQEQKHLFSTLLEARRVRRRKNAYAGKIIEAGASQPSRWHKIKHDELLQEMDLTVEDAYLFLQKVLGWSEGAIKSLSPNLKCLNMLIVSMLSRVPFHNLTLLTRERRPPTPDEIKRDMMAGLGGPCSVVNSFFGVLLDKLGFGPDVYLLR